MENNTENAVTETSSKYLKLKALATKTQDEIADEILALELRIETLQQSYEISRRSYTDMKITLRDYLAEQFEDNANSISMTREEANELLSNCGCDELEAEYEVTLTVEVTLTITAPNDDTAIDMAKDSLSVDNDDVNVIVTNWEVTDEVANVSE
jgi:hypothetical protein